MRLRLLEHRDMEKVKEIHEQYFEHEFAFSEFTQNAITAYVIENEIDEIVAAGSMRTILEASLITNKEIDIEDRRLAFLKALEFNKFVTRRKGYDSFHAFIQDDKWMKHLIRHGFRETVGKPLILVVS